jgi:hypothetical protein
MKGRTAGQPQGKVARNRVTRIRDGCVALEEYKGNGWVARAWTVWFDMIFRPRAAGAPSAAFRQDVKTREPRAAVSGRLERGTVRWQCEHRRLLEPR